MTAVAVERPGRPNAARLVWAQTRYANAGFWRAPIAAFFTLVFPLLFLILIGALAGNEVIDERSGLRLAQFLTPAMAVFGVATSAFTTLAIGVALDRDHGILKRLRGTPLPSWAYVVGRLCSAAWIALLAVLIITGVAVAFYGVEVVWRKLPALLLTLVAGIGCMAAVGLAVVALTPSATAVQAVTNAVLVPLAFISGLFTFGAEIPGWLDAIATFLPLKHFAEAFTEAFNPFTSGSGFAWDHLGVLAAWAAVGALIAIRFFHWEPGRSHAGRGRAAPAEDAPQQHAGRAPASTPGAVSEPSRAAVAGTHVDAVVEAGRPSVLQLVWGQVRHANAGFWRERAGAAFTVLFPVVLLLLIPQVFGRGTLPDRGIDLVQFLTPVMAVFGIAMTTYAVFPERLADARDKGTLKRVHGTPLPVWALVAGQIIAAVGIALIAFVITIAIGVAVYRIDLVWHKLPALVVTLVVGIACFTALGLLLASAAPSARSVPVLANATLLPLSFFSDVFLIGDLPAWMDAVGWVFPLKHLTNAVADQFNPTIAGAGWQLDHLAVMAAWLVGAAVLGMRLFTWEPRRGT